jgi:hypothetical protein
MLILSKPATTDLAFYKNGKIYTIDTDSMIDIYRDRYAYLLFIGELGV